MKILVVDDELVSRMALEKIMDSFGQCEVVESGSGAITAFQKALEEGAPFGLITLDINMPEMDGKEVLINIREIERKKEIPKEKQVIIIMATSSPDKEDVIACIQAGCNDYIVKPFNKEIVREKFDKHKIKWLPENGDRNDVQQSSPKTTTDIIGDAKPKFDAAEFTKPAAGIHGNVPERTNEEESVSDDKGTLREAVLGVVKKFKAGNIDLPVLPKVVHEIEEVIKKPDSDAKKLADVIERDAVISIRLLTVANSPIYRGTDKITTVRQAIPRLGVKETQSIVLTIASKSIYKTKNAQIMVLMEKLWLHSLASAYASKAIAQKLALGDVESFFLMGLLHDVGKVLLVRALTDIIPETDSISIDDVISTIQEVHCSFGEAYLLQGGSDEKFVQAAASHDKQKYFKTSKKEVLVVNLANYLTRKIGYSLFNDEEIVLSELESAELLVIDSGLLDAACEEVKAMMEATADIF